MAIAKIEAALGQLGDISDFVGATRLDVVVANSTTLTLMDLEGDGFTFTGTGLDYDFTGLIAGTFTGLRIFSAGGVTLETVSDFSTDAPAFYQIYATGGIEAGVLSLFATADLIKGSNVGDKLTGFAGNDTIKGGAGGDLIGGSLGRDKLFGEGGKDVFLFVRGDGHDRIMDFVDTNGPNDDRIGITHKMYNNMTVEETASGVTLHFGAKNSINVDGWHAVDVGVSDFIFG